VRLVPCDDRFQIDVNALRRLIETDLRRGLKPFCLVGSAGTVNTGAIDPLTKLAEIASDYDLWFHVDGAYGAFGAMDARKRSLFAGLERADSVSLDPHKWLYVPLDAGCLLFRDALSVGVAGGTASADYIRVHEKEDEEAFAFWDHSLELSRRFRALKIWFTLRYYGTERIAAAISEDNLLAEYLAERVTDSEDLELLAPVELSICCFRYAPRWLAEREGSATMLDQLNAEIMHTIQRGGKAYFSNAMIHGKFALRVCITNFRTTRADIDQTLETILQTAQDLKGKYSGDRH
jgi:aromatic-L-amino-acid/L-tryptophan decarboxylase